MTPDSHSASHTSSTDTAEVRRPIHANGTLNEQQPRRLGVRAESEPPPAHKRLASGMLAAADRGRYGMHPGKRKIDARADVVTDSSSTKSPTPSGGQPRYLTSEQTRRVYDRIGRIQDLQALYEHRAIAALLAHADFEHAHAVCELGYGTGALAERLLRDRLSNNARYSGIDLSPRMYELAKRRLDPYADRVELRLGNALPHLPYPDASFDRFLAAYVLDLLSPDDITRTLDEAHRLLAPGGLLCLASLTSGTTRPSRIPTRAWKALWSLEPTLVGGCRPITISDHLDQTAWTLRHHQTISTLAITSDVVVAAALPCPTAAGATVAT
jgi:ubiquinone/menaquinone biosynthesis C-methylase UbiE